MCHARPAQAIGGSGALTLGAIPLKARHLHEESGTRLSQFVKIRLSQARGFSDRRALVVKKGSGATEPQRKG